jgi:hypothetical protein
MRVGGFVHKKEMKNVLRTQTVASSRRRSSANAHERVRMAQPRFPLPAQKTRAMLFQTKPKMEKDFDPNVMPVVNIDEEIGKTVGRRRAPDPLQINEGQTKAAARAWQALKPLQKIRPGVYRFRSHEEADAWLLDKLIPTRAKTKAS